MSAWQPIETAPRYGNFLIWIPATDLPWPAYSQNGKLYSNSHGAVNDEKDSWSTKATHWMPLPEPPTPNSNCNEAGE